MTNPREAPINYFTGAAMSERQQYHLQSLQDAADLLLDVMHSAEGSVPPGQHQEHVYQTRRMNIAATHLETALMFARKAALETK